MISKFQKSIIDGFKVGKTPRELANELGVFQGSITRVLRKHCPEYERQSPPITDEQADHIVAEYIAKNSSEKIAKEMNINSSSVLRALKKRGIEIRSTSRNKHEPLVIIDVKKEECKIDKTNIENYATTYLATYKGNPLSTPYIKSLSNEQKIEAAEEVFQFYRANKFPYPVLSKEELIKDFDFLQTVDVSPFIENKIIQIHNRAGSDIFKHFNPHFWETKSADKNRPSILEAFNNDKCLKKVLINRLEQNYNITGSMIRQGLFTSKIAYRASIFTPVIAKTIYTAYCQEGDIIYDYSMGFGQRLLAALSMPFELTYIGVDPFEKSVQSNKDIFDFTHSNNLITNKKVELHCIGSEDYCPENLQGKVKLAFSSPPYFNLEVYDKGNEKQAYAGNDYVKFLEWWKKTANNTKKILMDDGIFAINVKEQVGKFDVLKDMLGVLFEAGYQEIDRYNIQVSKNTKFNNKTGQHKYEPIVILRKK